jgi:hypothetical protein
LKAAGLNQTVNVAVFHAEPPTQSDDLDGGDDARASPREHWENNFQGGFKSGLRFALALLVSGQVASENPPFWMAAGIQRQVEAAQRSIVQQADCEFTITIERGLNRGNADEAAAETNLRE